jgi:hypothetical protein
VQHRMMFCRIAKFRYWRNIVRKARVNKGL